MNLWTSISWCVSSLILWIRSWQPVSYSLNVGIHFFWTFWLILYCLLFLTSFIAIVMFYFYLNQEFPFKEPFSLKTTNINECDSNTGWGDYTETEDVFIKAEKVINTHLQCYHSTICSKHKLYKKRVESSQILPSP